ncbi:hypothetical protein Q7C30_000025 [Pseudomonas sp. RAC1]|uniref:DUF4376 domain-containing protein n=1 Tax=Pseudomonas sp. RAC1 TaxID=3064900 RepID=UPI002719DE70|nr:hypothetical protein [Pseudomonas sp. RAC1]MDV9030489.1 hypothetical protein [Pseudomonas sp. RAC1]
MRKTVYQTNAQGLYVGATQADLSPLEPDVWLLPGGCVETPPPAIPQNKAAHWDGAAWSLVDYYQGLVVYSIVSGEPQTLDGMVTIPSGYTLKKPGPDQVWKNGDWIDDNGAILAKLYQQKLIEVDSGCNQHIEGGFNSSALGQIHRYGSTLEDQVNLTGLMFSGLDSLYPCTGSDGINAFRDHTREQLLQVNRDLVLFKQAALQHADQLKRDLAKALQDKKLRAMRAIVWTAPV